MSNCDYWWFAGGVQWCDLLGGNCRCGGWEGSCALKKRRKKATRADQFDFEPEMNDRPRHGRHHHIQH